MSKFWDQEPEFPMPAAPIDQTISEIQSSLATAGRWRVAYLTQKTDSGIEIQGAPVEQFGWLVSTTMVPTGPGQLQPLFLVLPDSSEVPVITGGVRFVK